MRLAAAALAAAIIPLGAATAATAGPQAPAHRAPVSAVSAAPTMNLAAARAKILAKHLPGAPQVQLMKNGHDRFVNAKGQAVRRPNVVQDATNCTTTNCGDLTGGAAPVIQRHPQQYLLLWGSSWTAETTYKPAMQSLMAGIGLENTKQSGGNADSWLSAVHQYGESDGSPWFYAHGILGAVSGVYNTSYIDTSTPPVNATSAQVHAEILAFAAAQGITIGHQQTIILVGEQGSCIDGKGGPACNPAPTACASHSFATNAGGSNIAFEALPYPGDGFALGCLPQTNGTDVYTASNGHETVESITDPLITGWAMQGPPIEEVADACAGYQNVTLGNGTSVSMQSYFSNQEADFNGGGGQTGCTYTEGPLGPVGTYFTSGNIVNCINNGSGSVTNGNPITWTACDLTNANGKQMLTNDPASHHLLVQGKCIENLNGGGTGSPIQLNTCTTQQRQSWTWVADGTHPGFGQWQATFNVTKCLHHTNTLGVQLDIQPCDVTKTNNLWGSVDQYNP
jgi:hypothetical protein